MGYIGSSKEFILSTCSYLPGTDQDRVADCVSFEGQENGASWPLIRAMP
jgi:hypothetical protein